MWYHLYISRSDGAASCIYEVLRRSCFTGVQQQWYIPPTVVLRVCIYSSTIVLYFIFFVCCLYNVFFFFNVLALLSCAPEYTERLFLHAVLSLSLSFRLAVAVDVPVVFFFLLQNMLKMADDRGVELASRLNTIANEREGFMWNDTYARNRLDRMSQVRMDGWMGSVDGGVYSLFVCVRVDVFGGGGGVAKICYWLSCAYQDFGGCTSN